MKCAVCNREKAAADLHPYKFSPKGRPIRTCTSCAKYMDKRRKIDKENAADERRRMRRQ